MIRWILNYCQIVSFVIAVNCSTEIICLCVKVGMCCHCIQHMQLVIKS